MSWSNLQFVSLLFAVSHNTGNGKNNQKGPTNYESVISNFEVCTRPLSTSSAWSAFVFHAH